MSTFPTIIDTFTTHANGDVIQPAYDNAQQVALVALETKVGINASGDSTTLDYKLSGVTGSDKSASLAGTEVLTNKTLGTGSKILLGSDATLDLHYNSGSGTLARLPVGTSLQQLRVNSGATGLEYFTPAAQADASYAAKGVVEFLTDAATSGITVASGIANVNSGTSANQIVKLDGSAKLPAVDGSALTNLPTTAPWIKIATKTISAVSLTSAANVKIAEWTGLTGDTDDQYMIEFELNVSGAVGATGSLGLKINDDATTSVYQSNIIWNSGGTTVALANTTSNNGIIISQANAANDISNIFGTVKIAASRTLTGTTYMYVNGTTTMNTYNVQSIGGRYGFGISIAQLTSTQLYFSQSSGGTLTISGKATLYKINR